MWGADVDQLDALARDLNTAADRLESLTRLLGGRIGSVAWSGRDATSFRHDWPGRHAAGLRTVGEAMREAARTVTANAAEQRKASEASGGGSAGSPGWTAARVIKDIRQGAGKVGDGAEQVQFLADGAATGAGIVALAGVAMPPGVDVVDIAGAGLFAEAAAGVGETAGWIGVAGHAIEDPTSPDVQQELITQATTGMIPIPEGVLPVTGAVKGAAGVTETLMDKLGGE